ncbi:hypothetical protein AHF37_08772 [Paragonimus kellicotti]|nr:hypothetical protein AHF37_08772 [Paragonimus kellicotti]
MLRLTTIRATVPSVNTSNAIGVYIREEAVREALEKSRRQRLDALLPNKRRDNGRLSSGDVRCDAPSEFLSFGLRSRHPDPQLIVDSYGCRGLVRY